MERDNTEMMAFKIRKCKELGIKTGPLLMVEPLYYNGIPSDISTGYCYTEDGGLVFVEQKGNISYHSFKDDNDDIFCETVIEGLVRIKGGAKQC